MLQHLFYSFLDCDLMGNIWIILIFLYAVFNKITTNSKHFIGTFVMNIPNFGAAQSSILGYFLISLMIFLLPLWRRWWSLVFCLHSKELQISETKDSRGKLYRHMFQETNEPRQFLSRDNDPKWFGVWVVFLAQSQPWECEV